MIFGIIALVVVVALVAGFIGFVATGEGIGFFAGFAFVINIAFWLTIVAIIVHFVGKYW